MADKLTPKQEAFCLAYLKTGNASEAYRQAYDVADMTERTIQKRAGELLKNGAVTGRLTGLQAKEEVKALLSLEEHMEELRNLREMSKTHEQMSAAIAAEVKRGELRKFYVKQVETGAVGEFARAPDHELDEFIQSAAEELGLTGKGANGRAKH